ncbi:HD family phosphohydrolase [Desertivirga brevis]|uniref:HD family phosphohydrolase n=1 Tax=Desertivirga brevis TaxID=2810310 RepID=UPI001A95CDF1|nr:HDIG domain-containing metalloprotein [Pedobacter sp. SYSU D00873]
MFLSVAIVTLFLPKQPRFKYEYEKGKLWMNQDLISPYGFAIEKTPDELEKDRQDVLKSVQPIYKFESDVMDNELQTFFTDFELKWTTSGEKLSEKSLYKNFGASLLTSIYQRGVMTLSKRYQRSGENYNFQLINNNVSKQLNTVEAFTLETANKYAEQEIKNNAAIGNKEWLLSIVKDRIKQNYIFDELLTERLEEEGLRNISLTRGIVQKGELIVSNRALITPEVYQKLESLKNTFEKDDRIRGDKRVIFIGQFLLGGLIVSLLMIFLRLFRRDIYQDNRQISLILIVITSMMVTLSWAIQFKIPNVYYIPYAIVPIIIRILFDTRLALNIHLLVVLIAGFFVPNSFEFAFLQVTSGMVAIYSIKNLVKREQFLISALLILSDYFICFVGISLIRNGSFLQIEWLNFIPFIISVLLSLLAYPLIYLFEQIFGITSEVSLMELTNTNAKLLRELSYKAPGTFQHSLQVANLAEAAIYNIGGNGLLVRAGALYHDIGKMENPQYFIENQNKGSNPHDSLSYEASAQIIIRHVTKGIEIARRNHLPEIIIDFIRTHHGNTRMDYFYQSFLKNFPEKFVDENIFRYPGPIPFSKETGVLMLADSVEAASRSLKDPDAKSINSLVDRIIDYKLDQGQLNNSNITLKDIAMIRQIFKSMLMSIYHVRVDYDL